MEVWALILVKSAAGGVTPLKTTPAALRAFLATMAHRDVEDAPTAYRNKLTEWFVHADTALFGYRIWREQVRSANRDAAEVILGSRGARVSLGIRLTDKPQTQVGVFVVCPRGQAAIVSGA